MMEIQEIVRQINELGEQRESNILKIGKVVFDALQGMEYGAQKKIISEIKKDAELKVSPSYVWQGFNLVRSRPELLEGKGELSISHYLALYKSNISDGVRVQMEADAVSQNWSVRDLRKAISDWKKEKLKSEDQQKYERKVLLGKAHKIINRFEMKELRKFISEHGVLLETEKVESK